MGRNGAQHTPEATGAVLGDLDAQYGFKPHVIYNLFADQFIKGHSDVTGPQVAYAILNGISAKVLVAEA
jgi:hypothetical protein